MMLIGFMFPISSLYYVEIKSNKNKMKDKLGGILFLSSENINKTCVYS